MVDKILPVENTDYNVNVLDHFKNPRNVGVLKNADAEATVENPSCGDVTKIMIKVEEGVIKDIRFQTMGCAAAISTSSMLTELAKGKKLEDAENISSRDISLALGKLPSIKEHCSNLASDALKLAISNFRKKG